MLLLSSLVGVLRLYLGTKLVEPRTPNDNEWAAAYFRSQKNKSLVAVQKFYDF